MAYTKMTSKITVRLEDAIYYIENPQKTENLAYVYGGNCSPEFAAAQFDMIRRNADFTGKNLAYHFTQSFAPGETTPEQAYEIGKKLCEKFLLGEYQFVLATHTDKEHIHNHIIINSVNKFTGQSFSRQHDRNDNPAWKTVREISDDLCREYGLSIIKNPERGARKGHYEWEQEKAGNSWKAMLKNAIDDCVMTAESFEDFLWKMQEEKGYKIKQGKHLAFHAEGQYKDGRERYSRTKTLGWYYAEDQLRTRIDRRISFRQRQQEKETNATYVPFEKDERFIAIEGNIAENEGLKRWAMLQNMKNASKLINEMTEQGVDNGNELKNRAIDLYDTQLDMGAEIRRLEIEENELKLKLRKLKAYLKLVPVNEEYGKSANKKKFRLEHEKELNLYNSAREEVKPLLQDNGKLPSPQSLENELAEIRRQKAELSESCKGIKSEIAYIKRTQKRLENLEGKGIEKEKTDSLQ